MPVVFTLRAEEAEARFEKEGKLDTTLGELVAAEWIEELRLDGRASPLAYGWMLSRDWLLGMAGGGMLGGVSLCGSCRDQRAVELRLVLELDRSPLTRSPAAPKLCSAEAKVDTEAIDGARGFCSGVPKEKPIIELVEGAGSVPARS